MQYKKILLIDDDEDDQEIFLTALGKIKSPVECQTFTNASLALNELKANVISTDAIFLDLNMPIMNGQQFLMEIKKDEQLKAIPVIIFSTSSHEPTKLLMKEMGAHDFITKPENFNDLLDVLKTRLG